MDAKKRAALKAELEVQLEPQVVRAERFFDGNDDTVDRKTLRKATPNVFDLEFKPFARLDETRYDQLIRR